MRKAEARRNRRTFHEAVMQNHPAEARGEVLDFRPFLLRDARLFRLYEGTSQIQQILIGRAMIAGG